MKLPTWFGHISDSMLYRLRQPERRPRRVRLVSASQLRFLRNARNDYRKTGCPTASTKTDGLIGYLLLPFEASLLTGGRNQDPLDRFLKFIDLNIDSHTCEVGYVADQIGISPSYLRETIRLQCGTTPSRIIEKKKIERAIRLMADPELTLCRVARMSGYVLERSFRKAFRKRLNAAPSDVRRAILSSQNPFDEVSRWLSEL